MIPRQNFYVTNDYLQFLSRGPEREEEKDRVRTGQRKR